MQRAVWLFSLDCEQFTFLPLTTAGLKRYFLEYGATADGTDIELVHFRYRSEAMKWLRTTWETTGLARAKASLRAHRRPVAAFSCYTWNMPTFLRMIARLKETCPDILIIAGGAHVQHIEPYIHGAGIDLIAIGEGERTFTDVLDAPDTPAWSAIPGLAFVDAHGLAVRSPERPRLSDLDTMPSPLDVVPFAGLDGRNYSWAAYEAVRGCPYRCAFCQWGTGALGMTMRSFSLARVRDDLERIVAGAIEGILFCDSNFGALPDDADKADWLIDLKTRFGRPRHFATCWSKQHTLRVQGTARRLHQHGLLEHYTMALQTLTPRALAMSHRVNMTGYREAAAAMVRDGVPIVSELIWGLPGETLADFERNLDDLTTVFPSHTIYPYAMLPGTELFDRRAEYGIETVQLAPYGEARAEYIIACNTFDREEGLRGYALIAACIVLYRGALMPLTLRYIALRRGISMSRVLRAAWEAILERFGDRGAVLDDLDATTVFERREFVYRWILQHRDRAFEVIADAVAGELAATGYGAWTEAVGRVLCLDRMLCPRLGPQQPECAWFDFDAAAVIAALERMQLPEDRDLETSERRSVQILHDWDFGIDQVPKGLDPAESGLRARYPVWP